MNKTNKPKSSWRDLIRRVGSAWPARPQTETGLTGVRQDGEASALGGVPISSRPVAPPTAPKPFKLSNDEAAQLVVLFSKELQAALDRELKPRLLTGYETTMFVELMMLNLMGNFAVNSGVRPLSWITPIALKDDLTVRLDWLTDRLRSITEEIAEGRVRAMRATE